MLGYAPRGTNPICSNRFPGIISTVRRVLQIAIRRLGSRIRVTDTSTANRWATDG